MDHPPVAYLFLPSSLFFIYSLPYFKKITSSQNIFGNFCQDAEALLTSCPKQFFAIRNEHDDELVVLTISFRQTLINWIFDDIDDDNFAGPPKNSPATLKIDPVSSFLRVKIGL